MQILNLCDMTYSLSKSVRPRNALGSMATIGFMLKFLKIHIDL